MSMQTIDDNIKGILELNEKISENSINKNICVFGQGFVGLPLALSFAFRGCNVVGVDVDKNLVDETNNGETHHTETFHNVSIKTILNLMLEEKRYKATIDAENAVKQSNNIIVTVGIPIKNGEYILDYLENACINIGKNLKKGDLVIIRSTVIPGTTEEVCRPILEKYSGLKSGQDFYLAYASERIAEGFAFEEFANMPTLVGAINEESLKRASEVLGIVCKADIVGSSCIKAVETSKVFENVQRDLNIAMSQEFARFTEGLGIDIFEVIKLANTHSRVNLLTPGPGVGGYCIPNAYHYIEPKAKDLDLDMSILKLARAKNADLPKFFVEKAEELLEKKGKKLSDVNVAVFGLAMKDFSNDDRISPSVDICKLLLERGAKLKAFDPIVPTKYDFKVNTEEELLKNADLIFILTKQNSMNFNCDELKKYTNKEAIIIDTKAVIQKDEAEKSGFTYWRI
ncbi:UDP-N-acetyl-D-mannosaminuronic acid dehydrogenase [Clostridium cavendishii DSM 21758]|uniref:UDP-N-acetyl-D-mannosaminuronic acid dehydrogenase n=1 Tax=Clostridium cavendishii DSM 21758 TaxID=1121302 RepID=A0A1M6Q942_9CLOT|nr:nucleotide sugar dehydrogenase [Clostridium cavendishii]SHK16772.1 UDP-N-acetyl-D-mannosaminuronic acid dehydrogenase [Clostridium cavendishii DSM 21758]